MSRDLRSISSLRLPKQPPQSSHSFDPAGTHMARRSMQMDALSCADCHRSVKHASCITPSQQPCAPRRPSSCGPRRSGEADAAQRASMPESTTESTPRRIWHRILAQTETKGSSLPSQISLDAGGLSLVGIQLPVQAQQHGSKAVMLRMRVAFFLLQMLTSPQYTPHEVRRV